MNPPYTEKQCISNSDSGTDSTVIRGSEGPQYVETDHWDFEGTNGDKISDGMGFRGIMEPFHFEPCASDSDKDGDDERVC